MTKGFGLIGIIIAVGILAALAGGGFYFSKSSLDKSFVEFGLEKQEEALRLKEQLEKSSRQIEEIFGKQSEQISNFGGGIEISTWKTYRNEKYKFEVGYPQEWFILEESEDIILLNIASVQKSSYVHGLGIPPRGGMDVVVIEGTVPACKYSAATDFVDYSDSPGLHYFLKRICTGIFTINLGYTDHFGNPLKDSEIEIIKNTLDQILSTFKFTPTPN